MVSCARRGIRANHAIAPKKTRILIFKSPFNARSLKPRSQSPHGESASLHGGCGHCSYLLALGGTGEMSSQPSTSPPRQLLFGPFAFDEASGELQKHGVRLRLQGQPLQILVALIGRPGQVVTRDEFQRQLWTDSTFVDFEHGLNAAMNRLRQVLGDSADQPRYIETVAGRGYRFIGLRADGQRLLVPIVTSQEKSW